MRIKQFIISILFLFVYTLSFAHSLMPHANGFYAEHFPDACTENETEHLHEHQCNEINHACANDKVCIKHKDHCDDNVFDFLICLLSDSHHHHSTDIDDYFNNTDNVKVISNDRQFVKSIDFYQSKISSFTLEYLIKGDVNKYLSKKYFPPLLDSPSLRGPPAC